MGFLWVGLSWPLPWIGGINERALIPEGVAELSYFFIANLNLFFETL